MRLKCMLMACFLLGPSALAHADDAADARAIVDKAIAAVGGEAVLAKFKAATSKVKGKINVMGMEMTFSGDMANQNADQQKLSLELDIGGMKVSMTQVFNKTKGWTKFADQMMEMDDDKVKETLEELHAGWVATLAPLKDRAFTLATAGEVKVGDKPALGVRVSYKGRRDITLFFDKETHLLVKTEGRTKDDGGQEVNEETFYSGYSGKVLKQAMKLKILREGKEFAEMELSDFEPKEKLDDSVFMKP